jgi:predicted transcriptional regulator
MPRSNQIKRPTPKAEPMRNDETEPLTCVRWMTSRLHTVKPHDSVARARAILEERRINQLPVVKDGILVGIVTDRDLRDAVSTVTLQLISPAQSSQCRRRLTRFLSKW